MITITKIYIPTILLGVGVTVSSPAKVSALKALYCENLHAILTTSNSISEIRYNEKYQAGSWPANKTQEGCYCPEGTTLFNTVYDTCVASCGKREIV